MPNLEKQFEASIREHERLLRKVARIYTDTEADRQDLFQDIIIQVWKAYPRFRAESKFSTWLYRIAINTAISGLRKKKDFITATDPGEFHLDTPDNPPGSPEEEQLQWMYAAIAELNRVEKAIVMLYLEDKSYAEMEEILGITQGNLRVKMTRIKDKLRERSKTSEYGTR